MTSHQPDPSSPIAAPRRASGSRSALIALAIVAACLGALALCIAVFWALILFLAEPIDDGPDEGEVAYGSEWTNPAPLEEGSPASTTAAAPEACAAASCLSSSVVGSMLLTDEVRKP